MLPTIYTSIEFLTISDIHLNKEQEHIMQIEPYGLDLKNGMDLQTFVTLSNVIAQNVGDGKLVTDPAFVLYLGDIVGYQRDFELNRTILVEENEHILYSTLQKMFPNRPIISVFGNNDSFEKDYGNFTFHSMSPFETAIQFGFKNGFLSTGEVCEGQLFPIFPCILSQNQIQGYFTIKLHQALVLVGLNTVMFSPIHQATSNEIQDQVDFLQNTLDTAKTNGMLVLIAMHIPVGENVYDGSSFWKKPYQDMFLKVIRFYHSHISGILVSHTHMEEFKIIKIPDGQDIGEYFTAGLSTLHGNSPSFKMFEMDNKMDKWAINNYVTYQLHVEDEEIVLSKYYDFQATYCENTKSTIDINSCLDHILFNQTLPRFTVNNPNYEDYPVTHPESFYVD